MGPDNDNNMICFILGREDENTLRLSMWNGTAESAMVYIHSFDFDKAHDFQFVQRLSLIHICGAFAGDVIYLLFLVLLV